MFLASHFERWDPTSQQDPSSGGQLADSHSADGSYLDGPDCWTGGEGQPDEARAADLQGGVTQCWSGRVGRLTSLAPGRGKVVDGLHEVLVPESLLLSELQFPFLRISRWDHKAMKDA